MQKTLLRQEILQVVGEQIKTGSLTVAQSHEFRSKFSAGVSSVLGSEEVSSKIKSALLY
jgi:hypothetical protein